MRPRRRSRASRSRSLDGHGDPPLAPEGETQADAVAERLAGEGLAGLFVTTLRRTHRTAAPLAERTGLAPVVVPELREVSLGEWEGGEFRVRMAEGDPVALQAVAEERWEVIPGAETMVSLALRVRAGIEAIVGVGGPDVRVAAIVHGGVIGEAAARRPTAGRSRSCIPTTGRSRGWSCCRAARGCCARSTTPHISRKVGADG